MYKAVVADLDGTLLNDEKKTGKDDLSVLYGLGERGIKRIIATGRSLYSTYEVLKQDFPADYLIFAAGAGILDYKTGKIIKSDFIPSAEVKKITEKLISLRTDFQIRFKVPECHKYMFKRFRKHNPDFDMLNRLYSEFAFAFSGFEFIKDASRIIVISPDSGIVDLINEEFSDKYEIIRASSPLDGKSVWMEIYPKGINKGSALKFICKKTGIELSDILGLGNDYNDIHFLDITGKSFITDNAPEALKRKYDNTTNNNDNPLSKILKDF